MKRLVFFIILIGVVMALNSQERLISDESFNRRQITIQSISPDQEKSRAVRMADSLNLPSRLIYSDGTVKEIRRLNPNGKPEYLTTLNSNAAKTLSTNKVWFNGGAGYELSGDGIVVGVWDGGIYRSTHVEYEDRARVIDAFAEVIGHATHVGGTIGAAGIDSKARGMANEAIMEGYDWDNDLLEMDAAAKEGLLLSNHSYGFIIGWDYNIDEKRWEWYGDVDISEEEDYLFGFYHREAQEYDRIAYNSPYYLIVKSAGNDRGEGPSPGAEHYVWENGDWVVSTKIRDKDGGDDGFESLGPVSTAKNILSVGAIRDMPNGYIKPENVMITSFSAFGPTDDGRIKPDVVGNGESLYSTYSGSDADYRNSSGTSMSAPNVTGSMVLLQEYYFTVTGDYLKSASLKGLVLHTADDAGNAGPDYSYGWGVMNSLGAVRIINNTDFQQIQERSLVTDEEIRIRLFAGGSEPVKATICWTDLPGNVPEAQQNPTNRILVNDLDMRIIREVDSHEFKPFILDPIQPGNPATTGDNTIDNIEQVLIENPEKGFYEIVIKHKDDLSGGKQDFSLIISGLADEFFASGLTTLSDNNGSFLLTSADEYIPDMEAYWLIQPENEQSISLYFDFFATEQDADCLRVYDGVDSSAVLLAEFSGQLQEGDTTLLSTGEVLFVSFSSDQQNQDRGFNAIYCTTAPEDSFAIEGERYPCIGSSELYIVSGQAGTYYNWMPPSGWDIEVKENNIASLEIGLQNDHLDIIPYNRCGESPVSTLLIQPLSSAPTLSFFIGDTVLCVGEPGAISVDEQPGATYEWDLPGDWLGTSETHEITFIPSVIQGSIVVNARNACDYGDTLDIPILVKTIPDEVSVKSESDIICQNSMQVFYVDSADGTYYSWSVEPDWIIMGDEQNDTIYVQVGEESNYLFIKAVNECGFKNSNKFFLTSPQPENPVLKITSSEYMDCESLEVQNATSFSSIQWYLNNEIINSSNASGSRYIAYLPGIYTVKVMNRDGCELLQDIEDGIEISGQPYAAYAGPDGSIIVLNTTTNTATVKIYDFTGKVFEIATVDPGYNQVGSGFSGALIVTVSGPENHHATRVFTQ